MQIMKELTIQSHKFNKAKKQLKEFSEKIPSSVDLQTVATHGGLFDWFERNVKGEELNELMGQIQTYLITINDRQKESIKEFGQVYQALEALDKDYIRYILISIKAAEKASAQAQKSADEAKKNSIDIEKSIEVQKKTIDVLTKFKSQIDNYKHLTDIDELWTKTQNIEGDIASITHAIQGIEQSIEEQKKEYCGYSGQFNGFSTKYEEHVKHLHKKLKVSYLFASGSLVIALISIILNILGMF